VAQAQPVQTAAQVLLPEPVASEELVVQLVLLMQEAL
jgi:hypothetical protein